MDIKKEYERWLMNATADADVAAELKTLDDTKIEDAFYRDLAFGTGGLRGVIGAGTNRMNVYTVAKASQGLADYLKKNFAEPSVAIGYDSRIKSDVFAKVATGVFAANGVKVNIWPALMPVPTVSFATRYLHTSAGVMVTASHNPSKYNGYKVYGADGCQITTEAAAEILAEIEKLDIFADVKNSDFEAGMSNGIIRYIPDEVYTAFVEQVKSQSVLFGEEVNKNVAIVYSPLNGTGLKPVTRTLKEMGYTNITVVKEQEQPDGNFPTCPYPNPEIKEAMALGMIDFEDYRDLFNKYDTLTKISFDYAVVEKESSIQVLRYSGDWKDVGTWNMMAEVMADKTKGKVILDETCENTNVVNELNIPILCMGCKDMIVAASGDGILIADKERSGYMKPYVEKIETEAMYAEKSWGTYTVIDIQPGSMTVKVSMRAGEHMTYHMHNYREEVWTVVSGKGKAIVDGMEQVLRTGDVITIAAGCKHTVEAITALDMIEVQLGEEISVADKIKFPKE